MTNDSTKNDFQLSMVKEIELMRLTSVTSFVKFYPSPLGAVS